MRLQSIAYCWLFTGSASQSGLVVVIKLGVIHRKRLQRFAVATQEIHTDVFSCVCLG
jgi:hypothetical protein